MQMASINSYVHFWLLSFRVESYAHRANTLKNPINKAMKIIPTVNTTVTMNKKGATIIRSHFDKGTVLSAELES